MNQENKESGQAVPEGMEMWLHEKIKAAGHRGHLGTSLGGAWAKQETAQRLRGSAAAT